MLNYRLSHADGIDAFCTDFPMKVARAEWSACVIVFRPLPPGDGFTREACFDLLQRLHSEISASSATVTVADQGGPGQLALLGCQTKYPMITGEASDIDRWFTRELTVTTLWIGDVQVDRPLLSRVLAAFPPWFRAQIEIVALREVSDPATETTDLLFGPILQGSADEAHLVQLPVIKRGLQ